MAEYESIIAKMDDYLLSMGFTKSGEMYEKTLSETTDFKVTKHHYEMIASGMAYGGDMKYFSSLAESNYITIVEEGFEDALPLTDEEDIWLSEYTDDGSVGWDLISEWIWDHVKVTLNKQAFEKYKETLAA